MATRSTQQTIMIGDYESMAGKNSSPHVRACLHTLKELGSVFDIPGPTSKHWPLPGEVVQELWPRIQAQKNQSQDGIEERANKAWK
eukprot:10046959-Heterocapsa_arctica.AAC.1